jgi:hypothetical protein
MDGRYFEDFVVGQTFAPGERIRDVCFTLKSGHGHRRPQCLLSANSGHQRAVSFAQ